MAFVELVRPSTLKLLGGLSSGELTADAGVEWGDTAGGGVTGTLAFAARRLFFVAASPCEWAWSVGPCNNANNRQQETIPIGLVRLVFIVACPSFFGFVLKIIMGDLINPDSPLRKGR